MFPAPRSRRRPGGRVGAGLLALLAAAMVLMPGIRPTSADELSDKQNQRNQLNGLMDSLRQQIQDAKDQEAQLQAVIVSIDSRIDQTEQSINAAQARLDAIGVDLADAQAQLVATRAKLAQDKAQLSDQLVLIYKQGRTSTINQVLGASSFNEFMQRLIDLRQLAGSQQQTLKLVQQEEAQVNALVARIRKQQDEQKALLSQLHGQADALQVELGARQAAQDRLQQVQAADAQKLAEMQKSAAELDAQIAAIKEAMAEAARRGGGNGHFVWPEQGPITQGFGCTPYQFEPWDPNCPSHHFHTGIDIGAAWGTPVGAGDAGIAYTYYSSYGYGNHVIIVHGNGWVSIYGHLASFAVGNGQNVGRGQTIGYEGSTGNSTGPHLHFEIRLNDVPQNPLQYLS
jgi:murein DD-endopeptidase MepM/ murein hydrolase activator NlpD